jgi:zinc transport system ATP-binding protein
MKILLRLTGIEAGYNNDTVIKGISLDVHGHDFIGVIGPNGGGKTTLLKVILGLLQPAKGSVSFPDMPAGIRSIGYLPQGFSFDNQFPISVTDVVLSGLMGQKKLWHRTTKEEKHSALMLLERTGMLQYAHNPIGELSGGQRQRVLLCRALVHQPRLLILDEPNTYVDKDFEMELYDLLRELNKEIAIILVSHDVGTITSMVKTIACVNGTLHYHPSPKIDAETLRHYNCPVEIVTHGTVPHRVLKNH